MKINLSTQEIYYKGTYFAFLKVKNWVNKDLIRSYRIGKPTLAADFSAIYKYAWDSIFYDFRKSGLLHEILNEILNSEEWTQEEKSFSLPTS